MHRIVIVGGGAGGLALATRLGRQVVADVTLVDATRTHVWKPLLHQLAAGSFDTHAEEIEYLAQARWNNFKFRLGRLENIDRKAKQIHLAASVDESGNEITPPSTLPYDTLVIAVGSQTNDFGTKGAAEHTIKLDTPQAARQFNDRLINACLRAQTVPRAPGSGHLTVTIVGAGATGVELAAELHAAARVLANFGFENIHPERDLQIVLLEAAPRVLSQLPERLSTAAVRELRKLSVEVHTNEKVVEVTADSVRMASGRVIKSNITVWAAGVKANPFLKSLGGTDVLETNKLNQLVVTDRLRTTRDSNIFAFGDCAACPQPDGSLVPPRAQSAYQQAMYLAQHLPTLIGLYSRRSVPQPVVNASAAATSTSAAASASATSTTATATSTTATSKPTATPPSPPGADTVPPFLYMDRGSLVSLAEYSSVGSLMGSLTKGSLFVEGVIAKFMYWGLHKQHQLALSGWRRTILVTLSELIDRTYRPRIKLH
eukprot:m.55674 g.55674  ORF g.55674 m.55674 type:complete len:487 (+) comp13334_c0_seq1:137-1597(+)